MKDLIWRLQNIKGVDLTWRAVVDTHVHTSSDSLCTHSSGRSLRKRSSSLPPTKPVTDAPRCGHCSPMASSYAKMTSMPSLASCSVLFPIHLNPVNVSSWWIPSARATAPNIFEDTVLFNRAYLEAGGDEGERWVVRVQARLRGCT